MATKTKSPAKKRFIDNKDGTVTDTKTNLIWQKEDDGKERNWKDAKNYCDKNKANLPGKGWRMPTREELLTIVDLKRYGPAADSIFSAKSSWYWSSTPYAYGSVYAWVVYFDDGGVSWGVVSSGGCVRAVRQNS